ncbi:Di-copper centre-containing protein [Microthyrium microscopicum]|uniref:Di-copper centre-containing protein n=1 Tax=Microthyrium microscopicum TaxID=703497 RepID=A0A6A6U4B6_9PEZI|nr:Di-copper centre-containing protein [Microthyrium microscopicum]
MADTVAERGLYCILPPTATKDDVVFVLSGATVPMVFGQESRIEWDQRLLISRWSYRFIGEWRSLTVDERVKFTQAVNCLMSSPAKYKNYWPVIENRYDDFVALHVNQTEQSSVGWTNPDGTPGSFTPAHSHHAPGSTMESDDVHGSGSILPWHRYAITVYEDALVNECGWTMGVPYWNWHLDTTPAGGSWLQSPIFDPISGFGGNGAVVPKRGASPYPVTGTGGGCVATGPFANRTIRVGPFGKMVANNTRCLRRDFNPKVAENDATKKVLSRILRSKNYAEFCLRLGSLHGVGHSGIGGEVSILRGEMGDPFNSPNEPLFFLHHANLDYLWALWQEQDPKRLSDFSKQRGEEYGANTRLEMGVLAPVKLVKEVMDTQNRDQKGSLCFKYEGLSVESYSF